MKWIEYKVLCNESNNVFIDKKVGYSEANLVIAQSEAYNGIYEITEDSKDIIQKPEGIVVGGYNLWETSELSNAFIDLDGTIKASEKNQAKVLNKYIPVNNNESMYYQVWNPNEVVNSSNINRVAFFDENKIFIKNVNIPALNGEKYQSLFIKIPENSAYVKIASIVGSSSGIDDDIKIKFEFGNVPSDWSPFVPSDIKTQFSNVQTQLNNKVPSLKPNEAEIIEVGHRGWSEAPENTLPAWQEAVRRGFKYIEGDVAKTSDGAYVMLHDNTIDRTSNGSGDISSLTFVQASQYDYGSWKGAQYTGTKLPTFEEFISFCRNADVHPYIELKYNLTVTDIANLVTIVQKHGMKDSCTWVSFNDEWLNMVRSYLPCARLGYNNSDITEERLAIVERLMKGGPSFYFGDLQALNESGLTLARSKGIKVEAWGCHTAGEIKNAHSYISGFCVDYIRVANELMDANCILQSDGGVIVYYNENGTGIMCDGQTGSTEKNSVLLSDKSHRIKRLKIYYKFSDAMGIAEFQLDTDVQTNHAMWGKKTGGAYIPTTSTDSTGASNLRFGMMTWCVEKTNLGWTFQITQAGWIGLGFTTYANYSRGTDEKVNGYSPTDIKITSTGANEWNQRHWTQTAVEDQIAYCVYKIIGYDE